MFKIVIRSLFLTRGACQNATKRFFLSDAYKCEKAWSNRLKNPLFSKIDSINMYHELDSVFLNKLRVSVLDVDLFLSNAHDITFKNEIEDVLLRIRNCPECSTLPERATHAAIRYYMEHSPKEDLLNVLSDRINYGLFPDHYLTNLLMDKFLKEKDACTAVKIAVLQMLQEDFDHPIMKPLALHCCYNYLHSPDIWTVQKDSEPEDKEPIKVKVRFLRNPYFDDHFDIEVPNHLVGKTLWLFGHSLGGPVGTSSQLVGLVLYEKYEQCVKFLESVLSNKESLHAEAVQMAKEFAVKKPKQQEEAVESEVKEDSEHKKKVLEMLEKLDNSSLEKESLLGATRKLVEEAVKHQEAKDIEHQCQLYRQWEDERERHIKWEMEREEKLRVQEEVKKIKEQIEKEEQRLFFFDKENEIEVAAVENEEQEKSIRRYIPKGREKKLMMEDYIPPNL